MMRRDRYRLSTDEQSLAYFEDMGSGYRIWTIDRQGDGFRFVHPATGRVHVDVTVQVARVLSHMSEPRAAEPF